MPVMFKRSPRWDTVAYVALDLETTGLDPRRDRVLAIGMVPITGGVVRVGDAWRTLVRPPDPSAIPLAAMQAHHIVPEDLGGAPPMEQVLPQVLDRLRGAVVVVHHAPIDVAFLRAACRRAGVAWPAVPVVDTVRLLWKRAHRRRFVAAAPADPVLDLAGARRACGLPPYPRHDPIVDAIATAELFLVLRHALGARRLAEVAARR
jgi:DNA polymerase-3 subunit epsilon